MAASTGTRRIRTLLGSQRGVVMPMAMFILASLAVLMVTFLSLSAMEPRVSANHADLMQARHMAEAGIEWAFDVLVTTPDWSSVLQTGGGTMATGMTLPGLTLVNGTFTVTARNDIQAGDLQRTGLPALDPSGSTTVDGNGVIIVTSTGAFRGVTRQIQVVIRKPFAPIFGALNFAGVEADTTLDALPLLIDGRDYNRDDSPGPGAMKYAITTPVGTQASTGLSFQQTVGSAFDTPGKRNGLLGLSQLGGFTTGLDAVGTSTALTPSAVASFANIMKSSPSAQVIDGFVSAGFYCGGIIWPGNTGGVPSHTATYYGTCGGTQTVELGTPANPSIIYFKTSNINEPSILEMAGSLEGAGLLIVENSLFGVNGGYVGGHSFRWDGLIIVVGNGAGVLINSNPDTTIYGGLVVAPTDAPEYWWWAPSEFQKKGNFTLKYSSQNVSLVTSGRSGVRITSWRES